MAKQITLSLPKPRPAREEAKPEEITLYGKGAGLYSYLNVLAERLADPGFRSHPFEIRQ